MHITRARVEKLVNQSQINFMNSFNYSKSLPESHATISIPAKASFFKKLLAFAGPGYLIAVGYMDPGNWATDLAGGAQFGYALLSVIFISNIIAMLLQHLCIKLGVVTQYDLAQACRAYYSKSVSIFLWILAEIAIIACDLAEVIGSAIGLNLLFRIPLTLGVLITGLDVLILLMVQNKSFRYLEFLVVMLIVGILLCFGINIMLAKPHLGQVLLGLVPTAQLFKNPEMLYLAAGILGATVMPHNLYLHSSIVQTRNYGNSPEEKKEAIKFMSIDSTIALTLAFFINAAILIVSAAIFHTTGHFNVCEIQDAYRLLQPLLNSSLASTVFAIALLISGQNSTITGTLAGQIIMEGFIDLRLSPHMRRVLSRGLTIIPAIIGIIVLGEQCLAQLMIFSQVVLSMQLPFAIFPLVKFTSDKKIMGEFTNNKIIYMSAYAVSGFIVLLNLWLVYFVIKGN